MTLKEEFYYNRIKDLSREELISQMISLFIEREELSSDAVSNSDAIEAMHREYLKCKTELSEVQSENKALKEALTAIVEKEQLKANEIFGRGTEKLSELIGGSAPDEIIDEAESEAYEPDQDSSKTIDDKERHGRRKTPHGQRSKNLPSQRVNLDSLPQQSRFLFDQEKLDEEYGDGNWRIAFWKNKRTVEYPRMMTYCLNTYSPVISIGLEHSMASDQNHGILAGSFVSPSLMSYVYFERLFKSVPLYRLSEAFAQMGLEISRQTMTGWFIRFAETHFSLIFEKLQEKLMEIPYHQCDETFMKVIKDGRKAGSYSYMWVHRTSELYPCHPIILFCFELTRGTDHLRKFYEDFKGFITCDAYCSYRILETEKAEVIQICGCMMHLRRRFAESLSLINKKSLSDDDINALPETQALKLIGEIYNADEQLKLLDPSDRKEKRNEIVKPLVNAFYSYIENLPEDPLMSNHLKDAIGYAKNQKEYLCRFLDDGNIPIDDGATERAIKSFAISKKNSLFCNSISGANATAIMYSILETAKANGANVYIYFQYVLDKMTRHLDDKDLSFLDAMLPWSNEYREYEKYILIDPLRACVTGSPGKDPELPKTPRKRMRDSEAVNNENTVA